MAEHPVSPLRAAVTIVVCVAGIIVTGTYLAQLLGKATEAGGWAVLGWAVAVAAGALGTEYVIVRGGVRRRRKR